MTGTVNKEMLLDDVIELGEWRGSGRFVLPYPAVTSTHGMRMTSIGRLMPYHSNISADRCADTINEMLSRLADGRLGIRSFCKGGRSAETDLFCFRGDPGAPAAFICAGGGMRYVASIHEGFPHALRLSDMGFNAFVVQYRVRSMGDACRDLADAIRFVYEGSGLDVGSSYSTWGSSAGARIAAYLGTYGPGTFTDCDCPRPGCVVMAYTGHTEYSLNDPPTYAVVGSLDRIANPRVVLARSERLKSAGIDSEVRVVEGMGHGFGLGTGTRAEGWLDDAVGFWRRHLSQSR